MNTPIFVSLLVSGSLFLMGCGSKSEEEKKADGISDAASTESDPKYFTLDDSLKLKAGEIEEKTLLIEDGKMGVEGARAGGILGIGFEEVDGVMVGGFNLRDAIRMYQIYEKFHFAVDPPENSFERKRQEAEVEQFVAEQLERLKGIGAIEFRAKIRITKDYDFKKRSFGISHPQLSLVRGNELKGIGGGSLNFDFWTLPSPGAQMATQLRLGNSDSGAWLTIAEEPAEELFNAVKAVPETPLLLIVSGVLTESVTKFGANASVMVDDIFLKLGDKRFDFESLSGGFYGTTPPKKELVSGIKTKTTVFEHIENGPSARDVVASIASEARK